MRVLDNILEEINLNIKNSLDFGDEVIFWREAYLQAKDGKMAPLVNQGKENGHRISLDDRYPLQIYHRLIDSKTETDYSKGRGRYPYSLRKYTIRLVGIGDTKRLSLRYYEGNDDIKNLVYYSLPTRLSYDEKIASQNENTDKLFVLSEEFEGANFNKLSLQLIAFYIEYEIVQRVQCGETAINVPPVLCDSVEVISANGTIL